MEINNLLDKEFKATVIKMLTEFGKRLEEHSENFNKELETIKNNQLELKNTKTKMKNTLETINCRLGYRRCIRDLEDRMVEVT